MADKAVTAASDPGTPAEGWLYANTAAHTLNYYNGSAWIALASAAGTVPTSRTVATTAPLAGGGNLSADRTLSLMLAATPGLDTGAGLAVLLKGGGGLSKDGSGLFLSPSVPPTTRAIATTAPLSGGGDFSADRTFSLTLASVTPGLSVVGGGLAVTEQAFTRSCTLTSAASQVPVVCLSDADVGAGKVAYVTHWHIKINGATAWLGVTDVTIQDTAANVFVSIPVGMLVGNAFIDDGTATVVLDNPYSLGTGTASGKGIEIVADMTAASGSDLVLTIGGTIR